MEEESTQKTLAVEEAIQSISGKLMSDLRNALNSLHNVEQINLIEWLFLHEPRFGQEPKKTRYAGMLDKGRTEDVHRKTDNGIVRERQC